MKKKTAKKPAYRRHTVRNLLLLALVCAICWGVKGYPVSQEAHFRRMERGSLLEPSEIVFARYSERRSFLRRLRGLQGKPASKQKW